MERPHPAAVVHAVIGEAQNRRKVVGSVLGRVRENEAASFSTDILPVWVIVAGFQNIAEVAPPAATPAKDAP